MDTVDGMMIDEVEEVVDEIRVLVVVEIVALRSQRGGLLS